MFRLVVLCASLGVLAVPAEKTCQAATDCGIEEDQALLQLRRNRGSDLFSPDPRYDLSGKSVYLIMTDRFNRVDPLNATENENCVAEQNWCGGTLKGITEKVDYIQGMGFDAIWVTPVVRQPWGEDKGENCTTSSGYSYHGYWAQDYYEIDPHYGSSQDLKDLVSAVHKAGMILILDIVLNHMRMIHQPYDEWKVEGINPFNKEEYFHTRKPLDRPGGEDFDAYTKKFCNWPSPFQAFGPGTMCYLNISSEGIPDYTNNGNYCNNYKSPGFGQPQVYNASTYLGADAPGPPNLAYCGVGDYCHGYTNEAVWEGWFFDLGDLNHSHPFVRKTQMEWIRMMRDTYDLDGIRLDTAPYMPWTFLQKAQRAAHPLQIIGEVTSANISWHASFQYDPEGLGHVLAGLENFPPFYAATPGYCNDSGNQLSPVAMGTLRFLGEIMTRQLESGLYTNVGTLMNFMDNQDYEPVFHYCKGTPLVKNGLAWAIMSYGMPVITWGTEQGNTLYRERLWKLGFNNNTWQYKFIKKLHWVRKLKVSVHSRQRIATARTEVVHYSDTQLVFVRGGRWGGVWTFTSNLNTSAPVVYPVAPPGHHRPWVDILTDKKAKIVGGHLMAPNSDPVVLYLFGKQG